MAIKFLAVVFFFTLTVIYPIHKTFGGDEDFTQGNNSTGNDTATTELYHQQQVSFSSSPDIYMSEDPKSQADGLPTNYLWIYVVFVYFFTAIALYLIVTETKRIIRVRQRFLGTQSSVTDRTIRLSGIPSSLQSEQKIKQTIEDLEIGKVDSVMLCRDWRELDDLLVERMGLLRRLEESWTVHLGYRRVERNLESLPIAQPSPPGPAVEPDNDHEYSRLLADDRNEQSHITPYARDRPMTRIWFGFLNLQSRKIDAIDYYEEKLRKLDDRIRAARKKDYKPTPLAFITLDSPAACVSDGIVLGFRSLTKILQQMAVQAIMDPKPMQLLANLAPAPADVVWRNTYLPRSNRMLRSWSITAIIVVLTVFWSVLLVPLAALLNLESIHKVLPELADALKSRPITKSLVQTGLPTLLISLLNVLVPYLYNCRFSKHPTLKATLTICRACESSGNDFSGRCRAFRYTKEFLLHFL